MNTKKNRNNNNNNNKKDFYYSKTDTGKLIQNIVFEYMEDNLENMLGNYLKIRKLFTEDEVKVNEF